MHCWIARALLRSFEDAQSIAQAIKKKCLMPLLIGLVSRLTANISISHFQYYYVWQKFSWVGKKRKHKIFTSRLMTTNVSLA